MNDTERATPRYGGALLQSHDLVYKFSPQGQMLGPVVTETIKKYQPRARRILDLGCGAGEMTAYAMLVEPKAVIDAIDIDAHMLERAHVALYFSHISYDLRNLVTLQHDMRKFLFSTHPRTGGEPYDVVVSGWTLHNFPASERTVLLQGIYSVLAPGGLFVNMDKYLPHSRKQENVFRARRQMRYQALSFMSPSAAEAIRAHEAQDALPPYRQTARAGMKAMRDAGFQDVTLQARCELDAVISGVKR